MTYRIGDYVRIIGPGEYDTPALAGQVGQVVDTFGDGLVVETSPGARQWPSQGRYDPSKWDNFFADSLAPASDDDIAEYLIRHLSV